MHNRQVPRAEWFHFFREFSVRHQAQLVTVRVVSPTLGSQVQARDLALEGIVADASGRGPISIHVGSTAQMHVEHEVAHPSQIWVEISDDDAEEALEIESEDGSKTILQLSIGPRPETVEDLPNP